MNRWGFMPYVSVAEKRAKAEKKIKRLMKTNPGIKPIVLQSSTLANTWWGKAWNSNLEKYADYSNRIGRGRSYIRHGAVLDLQIKPGIVTSLVQGSKSNPYKVVIKINKIKKEVWDKIKNICENKLDSLNNLLEGKFPKELEEVFTAKGDGLFPSPSEITLECSCPDWAVVCKHVAAVLYGVGARLDENPNLFFELRSADVNELVEEALKANKKKLLDKAEEKSSRVIDSDKISSIFGLELDKKPTLLQNANEIISKSDEVPKKTKKIKVVKKIKKVKKANKVKKINKVGMTKKNKAIKR